MGTTHEGIDGLGLAQEDEASIRDFVESWESHHDPVLFAGAGLSRNARRRPGTIDDREFGTWNVLVDMLKRDLSGGDAAIARRLPLDFLKVAQMYESAFSRIRLEDRIREVVPVDSFEPGIVHDAIARIGWHAVLTTNYDDLLERAFERAAVPLRKVITDDHLTASRRHSAVLLLKLHGDLQHPRTIVISEEDYRRYERDRGGISLKARQLLLEHPVLFVGFSLGDPNFSKIDGWIRDTVGHLRVPAVAVSHDEPLPAERQLWHERGVHLVYVEGQLSRFFEALVAERERLRDERINGPKKEVDEIWKNLLSLRSKPETGWETAAAPLLVKAINLCERSSYASRFAQKLALVVRQPFADDSTDRPFGPIYNSLGPGQQRDFLLFCARHEIFFVWLDRVARIHVPDELLSKHAPALTPGQQGEALLARGLWRLEDQAVDGAAQDFREASRVATDWEVIERADIELRELMFTSGDEASIRADLAAPDRTSDVFAMCRRAADYLLLNDQTAARQWYQRAEKNARTGDETYAALLGLLACHADSTSVEIQWSLRRRLTRISADSSPRTEAVKTLRERAGLEALKHDLPRAIELLENSLLESRKLGWPQSTGWGSPVEASALAVVELLLRDHQDGRGFDRLEKALTISVRYGLDRSSESIEKSDAIDRPRLPIERSRIRQIVTRGGGLPASLAPRTLLKGAFLPFLSDEEIESHVTMVTGPAFQEGSWDNFRRLWASLREHIEHLPASVVPHVISAAARALDRDGLATAVRPGRFELGLWAEGGYFDVSGATLQPLFENVIRCFQRPLRPYDALTREAENVAEKFFDYGLLSESQKAILANVLASRLDALLLTKDGEFAQDTLGCVNVLLSEVPDAVLRPRVMENLERLFRETWRSSAFGQWVYTYSRVCRSAERTPSADVRHLLEQYVTAACEQPDPLIVEPRLAALLVSADVTLAGSDLSKTAQALTEKDPMALVNLVELDPVTVAKLAFAVLSRGNDETRKVALVALPKVAGAHFKNVDPPDEFLTNLTALSSIGDQLSRRCALNALQRLAARDRELPGGFESIKQLAEEVAQKDPEWKVRASALWVIARIGERPAASDHGKVILEDLAKVADVAIIRRISEIGVRRWNSKRG